MPRVIPKFDVDQVVTYVPDVEDNRLDALPVTVHLKPLTVSQRKAWTRRWAPRLQGVNPKQTAYRAEKMSEELLLDRVVEVENYRHGEDPIRTAEDFVTFAEEEIKADVIDAILRTGKLSEGDAKNSQSPHE
jgi:hypothetical protein